MDLDSSYATYLVKEILGLRPFFFHVDAGWNSNQAVLNKKNYESLKWIYTSLLIIKK